MDRSSSLKDGLTILLDVDLLILVGALTIVLDGAAPVLGITTFSDDFAYTTEAVDGGATVGVAVVG